MKMYVLDNGVIRIISDNKVTGGGTADIPIHSFLFDTPEGYVLFDTGCDPDGMSGAWPAHMQVNPYICLLYTSCKNGKALFCENFGSLGHNINGGFAQYLVIRQDKDVYKRQICVI